MAELVREHMRACAHAADKSHLPAWQAFDRRLGTCGDVGNWHETYVMPRNAAKRLSGLKLGG